MKKSSLPSALPAWSLAIPVFAMIALAVSYGRELPMWAVCFVGACLIVAVLGAVHHAEVVAHRVGEPFGTLVLAVAVTIIEVALIVALMFAGGEATGSLARDTVFAAIMIVCNGVVGLCLMVGAAKHVVVGFKTEATNPTLAVLLALSVLTLVLPAFTTTTSGGTFSASQLVFAGVVSLVLYGAFVFVQTVRHRDYFLAEGDDEDAHAAPPTTTVALVAGGLLMVCLVGVVGLAKTLAPTIEAAVDAAGAPHAVVGVIVALLVLLPETWAAVRAARHNRLQTSLNLALGSGIASIGLTIPVVTAVSLIWGQTLTLGLAPKEMVLLLLTFLVGTLTLAGGRATVLQGTVHLVLFAVFLFLAVVP